MKKNLEFEQNLFNQGHKYIVGIDEVGRGPLAGPFVVGAVILDLVDLFEKWANLGPETTARINDISEQNWYQHINDSKKLPEKKRKILEKYIKEHAIDFSIVEIPNEEIDTLGLSRVTQKAFFQSIQKLKIKPDFVLTDAFAIKEITEDTQMNIIEGDAKSMTIGAASIIAKVYRDELMVKMAEKYPHWGFEKHKGYGTRKHLDAIKLHGICDLHRKSFEPIRGICGGC